VCGVLDIGFQAARLYLIQRDRPVFARVVRGGGGELTETLAGALRVEFRIAEQYKRIYGVKQTDRGFRSVLGGLSQISERELPGVLYAILRTVFDAMAEEVERSYRFVLGRLQGASAGPLYLVGGGARLPGLTQILAERLGVPVSLPDPKTVVDTRRRRGEGEHPACTAHHFPVLAPCVGLAMLEERA
jgi:type IV pilus assembly protein PilM